MFYTEAKRVENQYLKDAMICFLSSILLALFARISIPLWFTPVPLATQNSIAIMLGLFLGGRKGFYATMGFLFYGICGLPVFTSGGSGILWLMGPTGGYLIGYLVASFAVGKISSHLKNKTPIKLFLSVFSGHLIILSLGSLWLGINYVGLNRCFLLGFLPFILGDMFKSIIIVKLFDSFTKREAVQ